MLIVPTTFSKFALDNIKPRFFDVIDYVYISYQYFMIFEDKINNTRQINVDSTNFSGSYDDQNDFDQ